MARSPRLNIKHKMLRSYKVATVIDACKRRQSPVDVPSSNQPVSKFSVNPKEKGNRKAKYGVKKYTVQPIFLVGIRDCVASYHRTRWTGSTGRGLAVYFALYQCFVLTGSRPVFFTFILVTEDK